MPTPLLLQSSYSMTLFSSFLSILGASSFRVRSISARSDSLDLIDYFRLSGLDRVVGSSYSNISAYYAGYFEPPTGKHSHLYPEDIESASQEGPTVPSSTTTGICLIIVARIPVTLFYQSVGFLNGIYC